MVVGNDDPGRAVRHRVSKHLPWMHRASVYQSDGHYPDVEHLVGPVDGYGEEMLLLAVREMPDEGKYIGGLLYYQIMNGITGTAMPYFKKDLESAKIWDVSNYVARNFVGYTDYGVPPVGVDASYITPPNPALPYRPPAGKGDR